MPENETGRLEKLRSYGILDSLPEQTFDDLTRLTAFICGTPIAFIGFMDLDRLWLKARVGWEIPEVPRDMTFCAYTILESDLVIVSDTLEDKERFATCPLATHGGVRFYAGVPLISAEGYALGTLCAMDSIPRGLTPGQMDAVRKLAKQVVNLLELRRPCSEPPRTSPAGASHHNEQLLQRIVNSAMDAIITIDANFRVVVFNRAAEQIFSFPGADALGQPIEHFIPERFHRKFREYIQEFAVSDLPGRSLESPRELVGLRANGDEFPIEATISQADAEGEKLFTIILRDIGARLRMESELRHAQKMEAVGQLAGGVAHEFNNFLGVILGYSELLAESARENEQLTRYVGEIKTATQHAASLTRQLLAFSRKQVVEPQILDLNQAIWEGHKLLRRLVPANIDVVPILAPKLGRVKLDIGQVQHILINLVVNARDAMPEGGRVVIETADAELDDAFVSRHIGLRPGSYVMLSVSDTGSGIDTETRTHIFEPFYTTKQPGKGTGLGLSTIYGIVKKNEGHVTVESTVGRGTTFRIYLPRVQDEGVPARLTLCPQLEDACGETILIVEDDTALRRLLAASLERRRYRILAANDGAEALEIFRRHSDDIDLVVTDLVMPRVDGLHLRERILNIKPEVKFLFMSGYYEQIAEQSQRSLTRCGFLEKPFLPDELEEKVRELLSGEVAA
ncbi:MAG: response regulator [Acidobacteria bacterium]|nr:response regulator [Acidobacteriota bacterium]